MPMKFSTSLNWKHLLIPSAQVSHCLFALSSAAFDHGAGLNAEQRKRLAIGVELAAKPTTSLLLHPPLSGKHHRHQLPAFTPTNIGCSITGLDSQAALSMCALLRKIAQTGLAILCTVTQPSSRVLQSFDRLLLLGKGGKQLYFGKTGSGCKTIASYFERNGARSCGANENPAEWMLEITDTTDGSGNSHDWSQIWNDSPERKAMKAKLVHLKSKFSQSPELSDSSSTSDTSTASANAIDALALEREWRFLFCLQYI